MSYEQIILGSILYAIALIIFAMGVFALIKIKTPGVMAFGLLLIASSIYVAGYAMELMSLTLAEVDFWSKIQYIAMPFIPAIWVVLSIEYCNIISKHRRFIYFIFFLIPIITLVLRMTSQFHSLYYINMELVSNGNFQVLRFDKGPWYYIQIVYSLLCAIYATRNYIIFSKKVVALMRRQALIMAAASIVPVLALLLNVYKLTPYGVDVGPFALLFDYSLFMYGMYRYNMLSLVPIAREKVFDWIQDGVLVLDMNLMVIDMNMAVKKIFPLLMNLRYGIHLDKILPDQQELIQQIQIWNQDVNSSQNLQLDMKETNADNTDRHFQLRLTKFFEGKIQLGSTLIIDDVTSTKAMVDQLVNTARVDSVTGLMNRRYFFERVEYEVERANRNKSTFAFIFFDLDNFKSINDMYGHSVGDSLIIHISELCRKDLRSIDLLTRFGGDEFIIYLPDCDSINAYEVAERLRSSFEKDAMDFLGNQLKVSASFGVASHDVALQGECTDVNTIFRASDEAMYDAKKNGKNMVHIKPSSSVEGSLFDIQHNTDETTTQNRQN